MLSISFPFLLCFQFEMKLEIHFNIVLSIIIIIHFRGVLFFRIISQIESKRSNQFQNARLQFPNPRFSWSKNWIPKCQIFWPSICSESSYQRLKEISSCPVWINRFINQTNNFQFKIGKTNWWFLVTVSIVSRW